MQKIKTEAQNKLLIMARSERQAEFLKNSLYDILGNKLTIRSYIHDHNQAEKLAGIISWQPAMIITLDAQAFQLAAQMFATESIVPATLDVGEPRFLEQLLQLPAGKQVLLVHKTEFSAIETIRSLINFGVDHIEYIPYWQNCHIDYGNIDTAISTVSFEYCPGNIKTKIDLGFRKLSFSAFVEILKKFELSMEYADQYANRERQSLLTPYKHLGRDFLGGDDYNALRIMIDDMHDAVITIGRQQQVMDINDAAQQMLELKRDRVIGQHLETVLPVDFMRILQDGALPQKELHLTVNRLPVTAAFYPLPNSKTVLGALIIRPVDNKKGQTALISPRRSNNTKYTFADIISANSELDRLIEHGQTLSRTTLPILISGESGTGKEMFAQAIHNNSTRAGKPFVAVNFAALPENLIESELFGYEEGAFTGARKSGKTGLLELANGGTIFLDEIGDASMAAQTRLLRVLEEKEFMRVGGTKIIPIDIRVISATNKDLKQAIREGLFREDLYYRLRGFPLTLPPLRQQKASLMRIIEALLKAGGQEKTFSAEATACILNYSWEGNMRELKNMLEYVTQTAPHNMVEISELPVYLLEQHQTQQQEQQQGAGIKPQIAELSNVCDLQLAKLLLETIARNQQAGKITGRNYLLQCCKAKGLPLTENRLRGLLKQLQILGIIEVGSTKQGSRLSAKGAQLLQML